MIALVRVMPFTVYSKVASLPVAKVKVSVPTAAALTLAGRNGVELNGGPVVRNSWPEYLPRPVFSAVAASHSGEPSVS